MPGTDDDPEREGKTFTKIPVAVAMGYTPGSGEAPVVLASGKGAVAEQVRQIALAHGIEVRKDPDLAQLLSVIDVDSQIPVEAFAAVAEILAYVYRANGKDISSPPLSDENGKND